MTNLLKYMKDNPNINRTIGYVILFIGFILFYKGFHYPTQEDPLNGHNIFLIGISVIMMIVSMVWMLLKVRCPHCHKLLNLKLYHIDVCPYCGKKIK